MRGRTGGRIGHETQGVGIARPLIRPLRGHLLLQGEKEGRTVDRTLARAYAHPITSSAGKEGFAMTVVEHAALRGA